MEPSASLLSRAQVAPSAGRRPWIDHWLETVRDLKDLKASHPMMDAVIDEIDGRTIRALSPRRTRSAGPSRRAGS